MSITPVGAVGTESSQLTSAKNVQKNRTLPVDNQSPHSPSDISADKAHNAGASAAAPTPYAPSKISTAGFVDLRGGENDDFQILDKVIEKIHKNIEELGEALEGIMKMVEKTNEQALGMQILEKTFEAIDEMRGKVSKK